MLLVPREVKTRHCQTTCATVSITREAMQSVPPSVQATGPTAACPRMPVQRHSMRLWCPNQVKRPLKLCRYHMCLQGRACPLNCGAIVKRSVKM